MSKIAVRIDGASVERARTLLSGVPGGMSKVLPRAINRALTAGRAQVSKSVRERYTVAASEVKKSLRLVRARKTEPSGEIVSEGLQLPLRAFKHSPSDESTTGAARRKVRVTVRKGGTFSLDRGFKWLGHIFARQPGIKSRVYIDSKGKKRRGEPIERLAGPSVPSMVESAAAQSAALRMREVFEQRLEHEASALLQKVSK